MKTNLATALLSVLTFISLASAEVTGGPERVDDGAAAVRAVDVGRIAGGDRATTVEVALTPTYVWSYTRGGLSQMILHAHRSGYRTVGTPFIAWVPEAGGRAWMIYIVPDDSPWG
jgi:hypothetical protein